MDRENQILQKVYAGHWVNHLPRVCVEARCLTLFLQGQKMCIRDRAKTYFPTLLASGVKIYEYTPGFIHAKVFVSDNSRAVVGTINLDYRSLYHHFECATYLYRTSSVLAIEEDFQATKDQCHRVSTTDVEKLPFHQKALGLLTKLVAPLM